MSDFNILLSKLQMATSDDERAWIVLEFNLHMQPECIQKAIFVSAITPWFQYDMLNFLLDKKISTVEFENLISLPYIESFSDKGWSVHEKTRTILRNNLWNTDKDYFRNISRLAATWCRKYHSSEIDWKIEAVCHSLIAEEKKSIQNFINLGFSLLNKYQYTLVEILIQKSLAISISGWSEKHVFGWALYLSASLDTLWSKNIEAINTIRHVLNTNETEEVLLNARCMKLLADTNARLSNLPIAREFYNKAIALFKSIKNDLDEANCIRELGGLSHRTGNYQDALDYIKRALKIYKTFSDEIGIANCKQALGDIYTNQNKYAISENFYNEALLIYKKNEIVTGEANCIDSIGEIKMRIWNFSDAEKFYMRALKKFTSIGDRLGEANCIYGLGKFNFSSYAPIEAEKQYEKSLKIYREIKEIVGQANCIRSISEIYLHHFYNASIAVPMLEEALRLCLSSEYLIGAGNCLMLLGECNAMLGNMQEAINKTNEAIRLYDDLNIPHDLANCYANMAYCYEINKNRKEAIAFYTLAIELSEDTSFYNSRASCYIKDFNFSYAKIDLDKAYELNEKNYNINLNRGKILLHEKNPLQAEFEISLALKKSPASGIIHLWLCIAQALNQKKWYNNFQFGYLNTFNPNEIDYLIYDLDLFLKIYELKILKEIKIEIEKMRGEKIEINSKLETPISLQFKK